jgi:predicted metal-dependent hydrolase
MNDGELEGYAARAADLWNAGRYFDVHEILEIPWAACKHERKTEPAKDPRRNAYHGLILLAAAVLHWERGNALGVERKLEGARNALAHAPATIPGLVLASFVPAVVASLEAGARGEPFASARIPAWPAAQKPKHA